MPSLHAFSCIYLYNFVNGYIFSVSYVNMILFQMSMEIFIGFTDGTRHHSCNLASTSWFIYSPIGQLDASRGTCLGSSTNNMNTISSLSCLDMLLYMVFFVLILGSTLS